MIGDIEGQAATFTWTASANTTKAAPLSAISYMVCFQHGDIAWEIHLASYIATQDQANTEFYHILETFQILY